MKRNGNTAANRQNCKGELGTLMKKLWIAVAVVLVTVPAKGAELEKKLRELAATHQGKVALYAKNLTTGERVSLDGQRPVQTASVIKLPLMLQIFQQVKAGKLKLSAA